MRTRRWITFVALAAMLMLALSATGCGSGDGDTASEEGVAVVTLDWEAPVDMDLEIWDVEGTQQLSAAWQQGEDVTTGGEGTETFEFVDFEEGDFSTGEYTVFVYMADDMGHTEEAEFEVNVTDADGDVTTYTEMLSAEVPNNLWRGFKIDAATGEILEELNEYVGDQLE
jgi:hypothetical protein